MKKVNEEELWSRIVDAAQILPYRIEIPLSMLSSIIWPGYDESKTRYWNQILSRIIRQHGGKIARRNGKRYVLIPRHALAKSVKSRRKSGRPSPERALAEVVWPW